MSYLLALDAGTGSIRAVIFDLSGHQVAVGQAEWKHLSVENVPGSMEFDLTTNWLLACQCIRQALANAHLQAADIQSVACCSMREGIVLYDRNGEAIWACANVDARASREVAELKEIHDYQFESEVYDVSGQTLALSAMPRLLWLAHHRPDIYRQAATITMISDWLAAKLSGELAVDPPMPVPPACSTCSAATGARRCSIWPGCVPICSRRSKRPALRSAR
jgi:autoinducer 2 (AI-2) kinase